MDRIHGKSRINSRILKEKVNNVFLRIINYYTIGHIVNNELINDLKQFSSSDHQTLFRISKNQGLLSVIYSYIIQEKIFERINASKELKIQWDLAHINIKDRYIRQLQMLSELNTIASNNNLDIVVLKGWNFAKYYKDSSYREAGDVDIYVPNGYDKLNKVIEDSGFKIKKITSLHSSFIIKDVEIENHKTFLNHLKSNIDKRLNDYLESYSKDYKFTKDQLPNGDSIIVPSANFNAIYLTQHNIHHFLQQGAVLRYIYDLALFFSNQYNNVNINEFLKIIEQEKIDNIFYSFISVAVKHLNFPESYFPIPNHLKKRVEKTSNKIIAEFFSNSIREIKAKEVVKLNFLGRKFLIINNLYKSSWRYNSVYRGYFFRTLVFKLIKH